MEEIKGCGAFAARMWVAENLKDDEGAYLRYSPRRSARAMFFCSWAELLKQSRKPENFFRLDFKQSGDLLNFKSLA